MVSANYPHQVEEKTIKTYKEWIEDTWISME